MFEFWKKHFHFNSEIVNEIQPKRNPISSGSFNHIIRKLFFAPWKLFTTQNTRKRSVKSRNFCQKILSIATTFPTVLLFKSWLQYLVLSLSCRKHETYDVLMWCSMCWCVDDNVLTCWRLVLTIALRWWCWCEDVLRCCWVGDCANCMLMRWWMWWWLCWCWIMRERKRGKITENHWRKSMHPTGSDVLMWDAVLMRWYSMLMCWCVGELECVDALMTVRMCWCVENGVGVLMESWWVLMLVRLCLDIVKGLVWWCGCVGAVCW